MNAVRNAVPRRLWVAPLAGVVLAGLTHPDQETLRWILAIALLPLAEEWIFRGQLQPALAAVPALARGRCGITRANVLASLVFAIAHVAAHPPLWAAATFLPSLAFGWCRDRTGRLAPCVALHAGCNAAYLLVERAVGA